MKVFGLLVSVFLVVSSVCVVPAYAQEQTVKLAPPSSDDTVDLNGAWKGWCRECRAEDFFLSLSQTEQGAAGGTIRITGPVSFGNGEKRISKGVVSGRKITFESTGDSGNVFFVELKVSSNGKKMTGNGTYKGKTFYLSFERS